MNSCFRKSVLGSAIAIGLLAGGQAAADVTGNVAVTNNYIWRGVTQTNDAAAVQGGVDYSHDSGIYLGAWLSNIAPLTAEDGTAADGSYEMDIYGGYSGSAGNFGYSIGVMYYYYPVDAGASKVTADFTEVQGSVSYGPVTAFVGYTVSKEASNVEENDTYYSLAGDFPLNEDTSVIALVGHYDWEEPTATDYTHYVLGVSKGEFTFALEQNDIKDADEPRFMVKWQHDINF